MRKTLLQQSGIEYEIVALARTDQQLITSVIVAAPVRQSYRWLARYRAEAAAGLGDRSSGRIIGLQRTRLQ
jgi:hypothetical protein